MVGEKFLIKKYSFQEDVTTFFEEADSYPDGVGAAFEKLESKISIVKGRKFFGIVDLSTSSIIYRAAVQENEEEEGARLNCSYFIIPKGEYLTITVSDGRNNSEAVQKGFEVLKRHSLAQRNGVAIEWYKGTNTIVCLIKCIEVQLGLYDRL